MERGAHWIPSVLSLFGLVACALVTATPTPPTAPSGNADPLGEGDTALPLSDDLVNWELYRDPRARFEFRHPPACTIIRHNDASVGVGSRIELAIRDASAGSLVDNVREFVEQKVQTNGWTIETQGPYHAGALYTQWTILTRFTREQF